MMLFKNHKIMKTTYFITLLFFCFLFSSFASESNSKISTHTEIITNHFVKKQQRFNFKEKLALKLVKRKFKKTQKKQIKNIKSDEVELILTVLIPSLAGLAGLIGGIIYLSLGQTLLGVLLLVGGLILIFLLIVILSALQHIC